MGSGYSQEDYDNAALEIYETASQHPCLLPDIGIDESLLKYSGIDSNAVLQAYSNALVNSVPGYIDRLGSSLAPMTSIPNAVGLGALVISIIMDICIKSATQTNDDSYSMLRRVFGEEKASAVRDTVSEYLRRHHTFINNDQRLREEIRRLEEQLSNHLTILRNSLLYDGQMSTRGFKIWVNAASFHLQMLIHEARLNIQVDRSASEYVNAIQTAITLYLQDLESLLVTYKTHWDGIRPTVRMLCHTSCSLPYCTVYSENCPDKSIYFFGTRTHGLCSGSELKEAFKNIAISRFDSDLKSYFSNIKNNLNYLINQHGSFTLPSTS